MKQNDHSEIVKRHLSQISDMLLLNGTLTENPGLVHGKTGIAIFFFHFAKYTQNMLYANYAMDLINETFSQIHVNSPADYEKGIAGIGVAIDYMIRNQFLTPEEDICEDLDLRMERAVMHDPWQDFSLYDGLTGYGRYWISRLLFPNSSKRSQDCLKQIIGLIEEHLENIPKEEQIDVYCFLHDVQKIPNFNFCIRILGQVKKWDLQTLGIEKLFSRLKNSVIGSNLLMVQHNNFFGKTSLIEISPKLIPNLDIEKPPVNMGLLNGYAGEGLLRLTALRKTNCDWMLLL